MLTLRKALMSEIDSASAEFSHDEESFRRKFPWPLIATNLKGAYAVPPPPDEFDISTANADDLVRHGLLWLGGPPTSDTLSLEAWRQLYSRKWRPENRVIPHLDPQVGRTHFLGERVQKVADNSYTDGTWAGAAIGLRGSWTGVCGSWVVPTVSQPSEPAGMIPGPTNMAGWTSSSWVGIDGYSNPALGIVSNDVLQAGVTQRIFTDGTTSYYSWYEWAVNPPPPVSPGYIYETPIPTVPVSPGQTVFVQVMYTANNTAGWFFFGNESTGKHYQLTLAPPPTATFSGNTIEWIMECPDGGEDNGISLPKFSPVVFNDAQGFGYETFYQGYLVRHAYPIVGDILNIADPAGKVLTSASSGLFQGKYSEFV
jgi:Peptidase A4 family